MLIFSLFKKKISFAAMYFTKNTPVYSEIELGIWFLSLKGTCNNYVGCAPDDAIKIHAEYRIYKNVDFYIQLYGLWTICKPTFHIFRKAKTLEKSLKS